VAISVFPQNTVRVARQVLNNAQILHLPTFPGGLVELVPAQGSGKIIVPLAISLKLHWVADYTNILAAGTMYVSDTDGNSYMATLQESGVSSKVSQFLAAGFSTAALMSIVQLTDVGETSAYVTSEAQTPTNKALAIGAYNGINGDYHDGHANNVLTVNVVYVVLDLGV